jgi:hypothetical protein
MHEVSVALTVALNTAIYWAAAEFIATRTGHASSANLAGLCVALGWVAGYVGGHAGTEGNSVDAARLVGGAFALLVIWSVSKRLSARAASGS